MDVAKFKIWLSERGCEILPPTNQYEAVRFKGRETGIVYTTGKTNGRFTTEAVRAFQTGGKWNGAPVSTGRHPGYRKEKARLLERDGSRCFFCGEELGDDITVEHLISLNRGGLNQLSNMVLAHSRCNQEAGTLPIYQKVEIAIRNRTK